MSSKAGTSKSEETKPPEDPPKEEKVEDTKTIIYPGPGKSEEILTKLYSSREHGEFCDLQLQFSSTKIVHAHKSLLALCSPYFEGMFSSAFMEATSEVVDLSHMCDRSDVLEQVIDTFYGRSFELNEGNVSDALNLATMLMLEDLKTECVKVLYGVLGLHNAAEMLQLAINYEIHDLREKIEPIISARFHDYILFQDDLYHLSVEGLDRLLDVIDTSYITRREKYIQFLFKWFNICESEERAQILLRAIKHIKFKLTKQSYVEYKDQLEDIINHLDDVNTDMSDESRAKLKQVLPRLIPNDYLQNVPVSHETSYSDVEMEPEFEMHPAPPEWIDVTFFGPQTKDYIPTAKENEAWKTAREEMVERDRNRELIKKWPPGSQKDPKRPKGLRIRYESPTPVHRTRKSLKKPGEEKPKVEMRDEMVDAVIILTPAPPYLEKLNAVTKKVWGEEEGDENMLMVCAYVPCTKSWYKITDLCTTSIINAFGGGSRRNDRENDRDRSMMEDEDEEIMHMMFMDMPEMLMMGGDMPHSHRMMREMSRSGMPSKMMRRMMERDPEGRHDHMMMREMSRRHGRFGGRGMNREYMRSYRSIPSLKDKSWQVIYFTHKLFFYTSDLLHTVYCYDLTSEKWSLTYIEYKCAKPERDTYDQVDGLNLIVIGESLYATHRVALIDTRENYMTMRLEDRVERAKKQNLQVMHVVYKLVRGDKNEMKWEKVMDSGKQYEYIDIETKHRDRVDDEHIRHMFNYGPRLKQPNCLGTQLFAPDEFTLIIIYMSHNIHHKHPERATHSISNFETIWLDIKEKEDLRSGPYHGTFMRTVTPLMSSDYGAMVNDKLEIMGIVDLMMASERRSWDASYKTEESPPSEFLDALEFYPRCSSIMCSANDGKRLWILRGKGDDSSETIEVTGKFFRAYRAHEKRQIIQNHHTPPPFKCFTLATAGKMSLSTVKSFGLPLKYMHAGQNAI